MELLGHAVTPPRCECWLTMLLFAVATASVAMADSPTEIKYGSCQNPLFKPLWFSASRASLNEVPVLHSDLTLCQKYNERDSCCNANLEANLLRTEFERRQRQLGMALGSVRDVETRVSEYVTSRPKALQEVQHEDLANFQELLRGLARLRSAAPTCLSAVTQYAAGMLCFSCRSDWVRFGVQPNISDIHGTEFLVRVRDYETRVVWVRCEEFGVRANHVIQALQDTGNLVDLAVGYQEAQRLRSRLSMFLNEASLTHGLYTSVVLRPIFGGERWNEAAAPLEEREPSLPSGFQAVEDLASHAELSFAPLEEGWRSGFETEWPSGEKASRLESLEPIHMEEVLTSPAQSPVRIGARGHVRTSMLWPWAFVLLLPCAPALYALSTVRHNPCGTPIRHTQTSFVGRSARETPLRSRRDDDEMSECESAEAQGLLHIDSSDLHLDGSD
mmetsp:Transcript_110891/g.192253  ORF Transcript_110891/g.192253 Transcript_110891/m.192253 type:complete len:445 (+) Transcript_110891:20-1354(+)